MLIELINANYSIRGKLLLNDVSVRVNEGDKIGIVGRNGCGKSTLVNILAEDLPVSSGVYTKHKKAKVMLVKQELPTDDKTVLEWLRSVDKDLVGLEDKLTRASDEDFGDISTQITELDEERYEKIAPRILAGLGLTSAECNAPMKNLSGGFCMRVSLAAALIQQPDVLLLDEPTNHLDFESSVWLTDFLQTYTKALVIVSHDVKFLNEVTNKTWGLQQGTLTARNVSYAIFVRENEFKKELDVKNNELITKKQAHAQKFIDEFGSDMDTASLAQSRKKWITKLETARITIVTEEKDIPITFPEVPMLESPIITMEEVSAGYGDKVVLDNITFALNQNARIGLLGRNGQGKSTFVKLLSDRLERKDSDDSILKKTGLRIGYFSQNQTDELNAELTVYEQLKLSTNIVDDAKLRGQLGRFGFDHKKIQSKVGKLSGGEKSRLFFTIIAAQNPHLLILDEPTNHLDIQTKDALVKAINTFNGAVVLVSHDWQLYEQTMKEFLLVENGKVSPYLKSLEHYKKTLLQDSPKLSAPAITPTVVKSANTNTESKENKSTHPRKESAKQKENNRTMNFGLFDMPIRRNPLAVPKEKAPPKMSRKRT